MLVIIPGGGPPWLYLLSVVGAIIIVAMLNIFRFFSKKRNAGWLNKIPKKTLRRGARNSKLKLFANIFLTSGRHYEYL